ncbi:hypothetical protein J6590_024176 [Homalodisca vitripennis]|nr:hypothetical protein J6590_024176 [Homalodisca vitripennis]
MLQTSGRQLPNEILPLSSVSVTKYSASVAVVQIGIIRFGPDQTGWTADTLSPTTPSIVPLPSCLGGPHYMLLITSFTGRLQMLRF